MAREISRRDFVRRSAGGLLCAAVGTLPGCQRGGIMGSKSVQPPNVLFIFIDQLRVQSVGYNGETNITTPHIDRLAREGMVFSNAVSTCPLCTPYRGMLQTGRYPTRTGIVMNWINPDVEEYTIAKAFGDSGYDTAFIGKWHLNSGMRTWTGLHREWEKKSDGDYHVTPSSLQKERQLLDAYEKEHPETEYVPPGPARLGYRHWQAYNFHIQFRQAPYYEDEPRRLIMPKYETDSEVDMAMAYMQKQQSIGRPFMLMVAPHPPHNPWRMQDAPEGYIDQVKANLDLRKNAVYPLVLDMPKGNDARNYYAMIKNVDDNIGRLMRFLDESGLTENTIVVFTSDHGEMLGSHGLHYKMVPYEESIGTPLIYRWPGRIPSGVIHSTVFTPMDHMPTLLSLSGISIPDCVEGVNLARSVLGEDRVGREDCLTANYTSDWDYCVTATKWPEWRGVRTQTHHYVRWLGGREALYHLQDDPYQLHNLVEEGKDIPTLNRLRKRLKDWLRQANDDFRPGTEYAEWFDNTRSVIKKRIKNI